MRSKYGGVCRGRGIAQAGRSLANNRENKDCSNATVVGRYTEEKGPWGETESSQVKIWGWEEGVVAHKKWGGRKGIKNEVTFKKSPIGKSSLRVERKASLATQMRWDSILVLKNRDSSART